jgi:hypothetical protein
MITRNLFRTEKLFSSWIVFSVLVFSVLNGLAGFSVLAQPTAAGPKADSLEKRIAEHVAAGEFPLAQELISQLPADQQDESRAKLFRQQINAGASQGAAVTALRFNSEDLRSVELSRLRGRYQGSESSSAELVDGNLPSATFAGGSNSGGLGGITQNDFFPLIDLITDTIAPSKWQDQDGSFSIRAFPAGVFVDHSATLRKLKVDRSKFSGMLKNRLGSSTSSNLWFEESGKRNANWSSGLRMVSLNRLERAAEIQHAMGLPFDNTMLNMAGLTEVKYVFVDSEKGEIVIAGPAGAWHQDSIGRAINTETGKPVLQLEDFVVVLRNAFHDSGKFGCSIEPRAKNLSAVQEFLQGPKRLDPTWKKQLRETMGQQDIVVFGIDPRTHAARVLVEADYHMKLVGMGLEPTIPEVPSYLDRLTFDPDNPVQPADVVRWWFAAKESDLACDDQMEFFEFVDAGVQVLSESEVLGRNGQRQHTWKSSGPTQGFARDFSKHFGRMANRYPVYQELQNLFSLALVANLIKHQQLDQRCHRGLTFFKGSEPEKKVNFQNHESATGLQASFPVRLSAAPKQVDSVMNERVFEHRMAGRTRRNTVFAVSGGVDFDAALLLKPDRLRQAEPFSVESIKRVENLEAPAWWWD